MPPPRLLTTARWKDSSDGLIIAKVQIERWRTYRCEGSIGRLDSSAGGYEWSCMYRMEAPRRYLEARASRLETSTRLARCAFESRLKTSTTVCGSEKFESSQTEVFKCEQHFQSLIIISAKDRMWKYVPSRKLNQDMYRPQLREHP